MCFCNMQFCLWIKEAEGEEKREARGQRETDKIWTEKWQSTRSTHVAFCFDLYYLESNSHCFG